MENQRSAIRSFLGLNEAAPSVTVTVHSRFRDKGFYRSSVSFESHGEQVQAFLFEPENPRPLAVVAIHQHNGEWHIGKSEVAGLVGDPWQAFAPALARAGITVLAPDSIGFESRRTFLGVHDTPVSSQPTHNSLERSEHDWLQYYNQAMHRLVRGDLLMRDVLADTANAVTALRALAGTSNVGILGHSYGGNVSLFAGALDPRIAFTVSSGAVCSFRHKLAHGTGLEMALVIPGFAARFDFLDLIRCVAPRSLLVVSSDADPLSADADDLVLQARPAFLKLSADEHLHHLRTPGAHALDQVRFDFIVNWITNQSGAAVERCPTE
jgi:dienelactone hydrolase